LDFNFVEAIFKEVTMSIQQKLFCTLILLLFTIAVPCIAEETKSDSGFNFSFDLGLGVESFGEDTNDDGIDDTTMTYQKLSLAPDIGFGKFGIGFELLFHYQFENNELTIREEDWVPADPTFLNYLELYLSKFRYVRYGHKGEPLYVKFGSIDDGTIGNGFIMGYYSNTLFLPDKRIFGLGFDLDGALFDFPLVGMETFAGNIVNWNVIGARLYFRPLVFFDIPIFNAMQIGGEVVADINPDAYYEDELSEAGIDVFEDAQVVFYDLDVRVPILSNDIISLAAFSDLGTYKFESVGAMLGFGGDLIKFITYGAQARFIGEGFMPNYFNGTYDLYKLSYYMNIERIDGADPPPGYVGYLFTLGTRIEGLFTLQITLDGPFSEVEPDNEYNPANYPHLRGTFNLAENLIPGIPGLSADAVYDKSLLRTFGDLIDPEGAFIQAKINYKIAPAVISFLYQLTYSSEDEWEITSGLETTISF
jgi:hypothetical protein